MRRKSIKLPMEVTYLTQEQKKRFIVNVIFIALVLALVWIGIRYMLRWLLPFVIAFLIALLLRRPLNFILSHTHLPRKVVAPIITLILVLLVAVLVAVASYKGVQELSAFAAWLPGWFQETAPQVAQGLNHRFQLLIDAIPAGWDAQIHLLADGVSDSIQTQLVSWSGNAVTWLASKAVSLPSTIITLVITLVATFFMSGELEQIRGFVRRQIPEAYMGAAQETWISFGRTVGKMLRSYLIIMSITFGELCIGLSVLRLEHAVVLAALIAVVDVLPVLGVGTVLLPWGIITLIIGDVPLGLGLLLLYAIISVLRNFLEPRIVGKRIGLNPLITLLCMYLGLQLFGIIGMFLVPLLFILVRDAQKAGLIHVWNE